MPFKFGWPKPKSEGVILWNCFSLMKIINNKNIILYSYDKKNCDPNRWTENVALMVFFTQPLLPAPPISFQQQSQSDLFKMQISFCLCPAKNCSVTSLCSWEKTPNTWHVAVLHGMTASFILIADLTGLYLFLTQTCQPHSGPWAFAVFYLWNFFPDLSPTDFWPLSKLTRGHTKWFCFVLFFRKAFSDQFPPPPTRSGCPVYGIS